MITIRRLLKSCATPPVSWPIASIFCAWRSASSMRARSANLLAQLGRRLVNLELQLLGAALASLKQCPHFILAMACARAPTEAVLVSVIGWTGRSSSETLPKGTTSCLPPCRYSGILTVTGQDDDR